MRVGNLCRSSVLLFIMLYFLQKSTLAIGIEERSPEKAVFIIEGDLEGKYFTSCDTCNVFQLKAKYDGFIQLNLKNANETSKVVTIYNLADLSVVTQGKTKLESQVNKFGFKTCKDSVYIIDWHVNDNESFEWSGKQEEITGISSNNAIPIKEEKVMTSHSSDTDQWYVYTAEEDSRVCISSVGLTNENTCLFVYKDPQEGSMASSMGKSGTLQAEVTIHCEKGKKYYLKWSNAFTSANYNWTIKSL